MENEDAYFLALGRFVHNYADAEAVIHFAFPAFTKIPIPMAQAIKRESKASELIPIIKSAVKINNFPAKTAEEIAYLFAQFEAITSFRNRVIHRGGRPQEDGTYRATNIASMKSAELMEIANFTINDIRAAASDLNRITLRLYYASGIAKPPAEHKDRLDAAFLAPWRYRPVQLQTPNSTPRPKPRSPARQRKSSPE